MPDKPAPPPPPPPPPPPGGGGTSDYTTTVSGVITIGSGAKKISQPVNATFPQPGGNFVFNYEATSLDTATQIPVGEFITWASSQLQIPGGDLPDTLRTLNVALWKLKFDTKGDIFDLEVEIGKTVDGKFNADWTPITGVSLVISEVKLEIKKETAPAPPVTPAKPTT